MPCERGAFDAGRVIPDAVERVNFLEVDVDVLRHVPVGIGQPSRHLVEAGDRRVAAQARNEIRQQRGRRDRNGAPTALESRRFDDVVVVDADIQFELVAAQRVDAFGAMRCVIQLVKMGADCVRGRG